MPTAPAPTRPSPSVPPRGPRSIALAVLIAVVAGAVALLVIATLLRPGPSRVDLTVENPSVYAVNVQVRPAAGGSIHQLGSISPGASRTFDSVIDVGDRWLFEFSYGGVDAGTLELLRDEVGSGPIVLPASIEATLRDAGLPPSPP